MASLVQARFADEDARTKLIAKLVADFDSPDGFDDEGCAAELAATLGVSAETCAEVLSATDVEQDAVSRLADAIRIALQQVPAPVPAGPNAEIRELDVALPGRSLKVNIATSGNVRDLLHKLRESHGLVVRGTDSLWTLRIEGHDEILPTWTTVSEIPVGVRLLCGPAQITSTNADQIRCATVRPFTSADLLRARESMV
mmetsp:Transcript_40171/g.96290  ORF Transcript_40171/g.96290 Transcript_40171/m.96290 type:complete len:199 (-) Transcript_40171:301-897(-)